MDGGTGVQRYLEADIGSITMEKMIVLLYERMIRDLSDAAGAIDSGDRVTMYARVNHAQRIITELNNALDHSAAPDLAANLEALYAFLFRENLRFLVDLDATHAHNCIRILKPLLEAWGGIPGGTSGPGHHPAENQVPDNGQRSGRDPAGSSKHSADQNPSLFSVSA